MGFLHMLFYMYLMYFDRIHPVILTCPSAIPIYLLPPLQVVSPLLSCSVCPSALQWGCL